MKNFILSLMLLCYSTQVLALHVVSPEIKLDINTKKVAHIVGPIIPSSLFQFALEMYTTMRVPGDRYIVINSPGGLVTEGSEIINLIQMEKSTGVRIVCVVVGEAVSMAFNTLSFCDVKLATKNSTFMAHDIFVMGLDPRIRWTSKNLRKLADALKEQNAPFREQNARALHVTEAQYDKFADHEHWFTTEDLIKMQYLDGTANVTN